jgi:NADH:ubiquinone oxidoreductase subunit K
MNVGIYHYLILSAILFSIGLVGVMTRRSIISMLIAIEILFNAINLMAVAFNRFLYPEQVVGQVFVVFIMTIAAAEAAVALAIMMSVYKNFNSLEMDELMKLKN